MQLARYITMIKPISPDSQSSCLSISQFIKNVLNTVMFQALCQAHERYRNDDQVSYVLDVSKNKMGSYHIT